MHKMTLIALTLYFASTSTLAQNLCPIVYSPYAGRFLGIDANVISKLKNNNYQAYPVVELTKEEVEKHGGLYLATDVIWSADFDTEGDCAVRLDIIKLHENGAQVVIDTSVEVGKGYGLYNTCTQVYNKALNKIKTCTPN